MRKKQSNAQKWDEGGSQAGVLDYCFVFMLKNYF